jgi:mannose-6-phosphate isomerase-like protein (cupin superfamily)
VKEIVRRVVTGHDATGKAVVALDGAAPAVFDDLGQPGLMFTEVWSTTGTPASVDSAPDPTLRPLQLAPPNQGSLIRVVDLPPEASGEAVPTPEMAHRIFDALGRAHATGEPGALHPMMHRTETIDYGIVLSGEVTLVLDDSEVVLKAGDVVVQRGTNHAWSNRSGKPCRMVFVLIDGAYRDNGKATTPL